MMRFDEFMTLALHDPVRGYYARRIQSVGGGRGDFTTAPMLSDLPARAIARWAADAMAATGCRDLIEIGPGEGRLAAAILSHLPPLRRFRTRLHLVETSVPLAQKQRALLGSRASYHSDPASALAACGGRAILYSNELVDAFPVRRFQRHAAGWHELFVQPNGQNPPDEVLQPATELPESSIWEIPHPPGQRVEIHESYRTWLSSWLPLWKAGRLLTIDYGSTADRLYHRRPGGTLRAYLLHQRLEGPAIYQNIGRQDLTADVNFTDLIEWSRPWTSSHQLSCFAEFLTAHATPKAPIDHQLLTPDGPATAFLALTQSPDNG